MVPFFYAEHGFKPCFISYMNKIRKFSFKNATV